MNVRMKDGAVYGDEQMERLKRKMQRVKCMEILREKQRLKRQERQKHR